MGSDYMPPTRIPLNVVTTPSHLVRPLQVADLVVGITTAMVGGATKYAGPLFPLVGQMMIRNAKDYIGGTGLKVFPDELWNLYHWVLGEDTYGRVGLNSGYTLPWREWLYYYDHNDPRREEHPY